MDHGNAQTVCGRPLRLRRERQRRGWSLFSVAVKTGIDPASLSQLERGLRPISTRWRRVIAETFQSSEAELFAPACDPDTTEEPR
jgi:transcriptional regulator with XRE-family HTH domain